jgi:hypothetical protein
MPPLTNACKGRWHCKWSLAAISAALVTPHRRARRRNMISSLEDAESFIMAWKTEESKLDILITSAGIAITCSGKITNYDGEMLVFSNDEVKFEMTLFVSLIKKIEFATPDEAVTERARQLAYAEGQECIWSFDLGHADIVLFGPKPKSEGGSGTLPGLFNF